MNSDNILRYNGKIYIPERLRQTVTKEIHENPAYGHPGTLRTTLLLKQKFWWPNLTKFVQQFIRGCATCQQMKTNTHPTRPDIQPIKSNFGTPFQSLSMDFITGFPKIMRQHDSIMVIVDRLTKVAHFIPLKSTFSASDVA